MQIHIIMSIKQIFSFNYSVSFTIHIRKKYIFLLPLSDSFFCNYWVCYLKILNIMGLLFFYKKVLPLFYLILKILIFRFSYLHMCVPLCGYVHVNKLFLEARRGVQIVWRCNKKVV